MERIQKQFIEKDLKKKLVFLVGPRQVGKTWLAKQIARSYSNHVYLNYDQIDDREIISEQAWLSSTELIIFDELHKMPGWKNYLKGLFDTKHSKQKILVTGSARLDTFRQYGDSLAGRFFTHRLLPFSMKELAKTGFNNDLNRILERGGFPEPFLTKNFDDAKRWRNQYSDGLIRNDVLDFDNIHDLKTLTTLIELLRRRVGSSISFSNLANDLNVSPNTIKKYIGVLESLFVIFKVTPFSKNIARSLIREPKLYFFDNGMVVGDDGAKFENFVAVSLLKHIWAMNDYKGENLHLNYLKTKDGKEVDFCIADFEGIKKSIEVKLSDKEVSPSLQYFSEKYNFASIQVVKNLRQERKKNKIEIRKGLNFLSGLYM